MIAGRVPSFQRGLRPVASWRKRPQVDYYAKFWTQMTSAPAKAGLFFVDAALER